MPGMEKVIDGLDCCLDIVKSGRWASGCISCPYAEEKNNCREKMVKDAIVLLKEQRAEIRQLRLALNIAKGTCNGINVEGR